MKDNLFAVGEVAVHFNEKVEHINDALGHPFKSGWFLRVTENMSKGENR